MSSYTAGRASRRPGRLKGLTALIAALVYIPVFLYLIKPPSPLWDILWGAAAFAWMAVAGSVVMVFRRKMPNEAKIARYALFVGAALFGLALRSDDPAKWFKLLALLLLLGLPLVYGLETRVERRLRLLDARPALPSPIAPHWRLNLDGSWEYYHDGNWSYIFDLAAFGGWGWKWTGVGPSTQPPAEIPPDPQTL